MVLPASLPAADTDSAQSLIESAVKGICRYVWNSVGEKHYGFCCCLRGFLYQTCKFSFPILKDLSYFHLGKNFGWGCCLFFFF